MGLQRRDNTELVLQTLDELKKPKKLTKEEKKAKSFKKISYTKAIDFIEKEKEKYAVTNIIEMIEHGCYATQLT